MTTRRKEKKRTKNMCLIRFLKTKTIIETNKILRIFHSAFRRIDTIITETITIKMNMTANTKTRVTLAIM